ncbi:hypothetical protein LO772_08540 [Yinghuangia sp. ASG 101]|uniref:hypothetical protein n=1 Tax=Yinghuangia sp. ASG 101 TaxID=2896848 RepID=UPI001E647EBF|nr:hypothetical protein [Yinghuangia sp. ASG 101]UGQ13633.1 hypothetical protein LO772_08540 [Yinghuangia sp. ASG 101]
MSVTAVDTCPECAVPLVRPNQYGTFKCHQCGHAWRVRPDSVNNCPGCGGVGGKRQGAENVWMLCLGCEGRGVLPTEARRVSDDSKCPKNNNGPHSMKREDYLTYKWKCTLCGHRR